MGAVSRVDDEREKRFFNNLNPGGKSAGAASIGKGN